MKTIKIICNNCDTEFNNDVNNDYVFHYENHTCPNCETYENLFEVESEIETISDFFITNNGNVLNVEKSIFQNLQGEFIRLVGYEELEFLKSVLTPVSFPNGVNQPETIPTWYFLWETKLNDYSDFYGPKSNNGGCYSTTVRTLYFYRNNNGKHEFCSLDYIKSSAEFSATSDGTLQDSNDIVTINLIGVDIDLKYDVWSMSGSIKDCSESPLDAHACKIASLDKVLYATSGEISSNYDDDGYYEGNSKTFYNELTLDEKVERFKKLKSLGVNPLNILYPYRNYKKIKKVRKPRARVKLS